MITVVFEAHGTTFDNEKQLPSGHFDVELSPLGIKQSKEMGERYKNEHSDAIFCSDLKRAYKSAEIAFADKYPIITDARLRECNYGEYTRKPELWAENEKAQRIIIPFPRGESYTDTIARMKSFLEHLKEKYDGKHIMIIGHRATQYGLEHLVNNIPLEKIIPSPWKWQPGWIYDLK